MTRAPTTSKEQRLRDAVQLAQTGNLQSARFAFEQAIAHDRRNVDLVYNLALVEEGLGNIEIAARLHTEVLAEKPRHGQAAHAFARLVARFQIEEPYNLAEAGLKAVLRAEGVAWQPVVDTAFAWLARGDADWRALLHGLDSADAKEDFARDCGLHLLGEATATCLKSELLHLCLRQGTLKHAGLELLLTGIRAALLLACSPSRFDDRALHELVLSLIVHGWKSDHAWAETPPETAALEALPVDRAALLAGDREAGRRFLLRALYRPLDQTVSPLLTADEARRLRPKSVREILVPHVTAAAGRREAAAAVASLRPLGDATSLKVAGQYEGAPYPRWGSLQTSQPGALKRSLLTQFAADRLAFMDGDFDILIAGCGTGQQALQAASAYGPRARMLALDLSRASLGYAGVMAERYDIRNVTFIQGDILDCALLERTFEIIECVGVLHHMTDWRAGWRALLGQLKPGGLMYLGLYSAVSRQNLAALRAEPGYPGPGCSEQAARTLRRELLLRDDADAGGDLKISRDFYNLNAFRDLTLHEREVHVTLAEIEAFLAEHDLVFRGFTIDPTITAEFLAGRPGTKPPGSLADWADFESANPRTFDGMYRFWVERQ